MELFIFLQNPVFSKFDMFKSLSLKNLFLWVTVIVIILFIIAIINAGKLPIYRTNILLLPFLLYVDFYLIYIFSYKLQFSGNYQKIISVIIAVTALIIPVFLAGLFVDFINWPHWFVFLNFSVLSTFYITKGIVFLILVCGNIYGFITKRKLIIYPSLNKASAVFAILIITIMSYGLFFTVRNISISKEEIVLSNLPNEFDSLKVVHISDLHLGSWLTTHSIKKLENTINTIKPDLIFITGDIVNFHSGEFLRFKEILADLNATYGVFSVPGNHDYGLYVSWESSIKREADFQHLTKLKEKIGWNVLLNENKRIERNGKSIYIAGVENWGLKSRFPKKGDINKALSGVDSSEVIMLLSHDPSYWETVIKNDYPFVDITFSGHTHGLQLGISNSLSVAPLFFKYWEGLYTSKKQNSYSYLHVNTGYGFIGYPGRIGVRPQISVITFLSPE